MGKIILGIDQGSSHTRAILFTNRGEKIGGSEAPLRTYYPRPGWVEHNPKELLESVITAIRNALQKGAVKKVSAIGIANQRSTILCWDRKTGEPVTPAISWQDGRTEGSLRRWEDPAIKEKTGLPLTCYYSATKLHWLLNQIGRKKNIVAGTVNTFIIWHLTKGRSHATDATNAQRTLLYNMTQKEYDPDLLRHFKIPREMLPNIAPTQAHFGEAILDGVGIPITASIGDQQASFVGLMGLKAHVANINYGTGGFLLIHTGTQPIGVPGLLVSIAWSDKKSTHYLIEGGVNMVGSLFTWLQNVGLLKSIREIDSACRRSKQSILFLPALTGLAAPHWKKSQGGLFGLTPLTRREDILRGAVEGIAYLMNDIYHVVPHPIKKQIQKMIATGGGAHISSLIQFQADLFGKTIEMAADPESTVRGAAFLAGLTAGFTDETRFRFVPVRKKITPTISPKERARLIERWQRALSLVDLP